MEIRDRIALITGASRGIGAACAEAFRRSGARIVMTARDEASLLRHASADDLVVAGDITFPEFRAQLVERAIQRFGRIDILINNAGAGIYWPPSTAPLDEVRRMFELNLIAPLGLSQLILPHMRKQNSGCVVNVSSMGGEVMLPWIPVYCASKFAVSALTSAMRSELSGSGIRAMTVCPGYVETEFKTHALGPRPPSGAMPSPGSSMFAITPEQCAAAILSGVKRNARIIVTPRVGWMLIVLQRLFPRLVESRLTSYMKSMTTGAPA